MKGLDVPYAKADSKTLPSYKPFMNNDNILPASGALEYDAESVHDMSEKVFDSHNLKND